MAQFKDHFSTVAGGYGEFRPGYPLALFSWLAGRAPGRGRALDLGAGNGQAAVLLAAFFDEVVAVEPSAAQLAQARPHPRVRYVEAPAEDTGLPGRCAELAVAAQAFHWFDPEPFGREVARLLRPRGLFAAVTYDLCSVAPAVDAEVSRLYREIVGPFWPAERRHVETGYRSLPFPFPELQAPAFENAEDWPLARFVGYLGTWSAVEKYRKAKGADPVALVLPALRAAWGDPEEPKRVRWPLAIRVGHAPG